MAPSNTGTGALSIRPATATDASALADLGALVFRHTYGGAIPSAILDPYLARTFASTAIRRALADDATNYLVATIADQAVGYSKCAAPAPPPCVTPTQTIELVNLYVHPAHQGRGIGRALLHRAVQEAHTSGFTTMSLCVWQENRTALNFYQRLGFVAIGQTEILVDGVVFADWVMQKALSPSGPQSGSLASQ